MQNNTKADLLLLYHSCSAGFSFEHAGPGCARLGSDNQTPCGGNTTAAITSLAPAGVNQCVCVHVFVRGGVCQTTDRG